MKRTPIRKVSSKQRLVKKKDQLFYEECFNESNKKCEECDIELGEKYKPIYVSHILTKNSYPSLRHYKLNVNILCELHHHIWEFGDRKAMKIYEGNRLRMDDMISKYYRDGIPN